MKMNEIEIVMDVFRCEMYVFFLGYGLGFFNLCPVFSYDVLIVEYVINKNLFI